MEVESLLRDVRRGRTTDALLTERPAKQFKGAGKGKSKACSAQTVLPTLVRDYLLHKAEVSQVLNAKIITILFRTNAESNAWRQLGETHIDTFRSSIGSISQCSSSFCRFSTCIGC